MTTSQDPAAITTPSSVAIASTQCAITRVYSAGAAATPLVRILTAPPPPPPRHPHASTHAQALMYAKHEFGEP